MSDADLDHVDFFGYNLVQDHPSDLRTSQLAHGDVCSELIESRADAAIDHHENFHTQMGSDL